MARTFHGERAEHRTGRAHRAAQLRAADAIIDTLDAIADRRAERHAGELERARSNRHADLDGRLIADTLGDTIADRLIEMDVWTR